MQVDTVPTPAAVKRARRHAVGGKMRPGFEGGQLPLIKRLPKKRGFHNKFRTEYAVVNLFALNEFEAGSEVSLKVLMTSGLVKDASKPVKVLADGELDRAITVKAHKFSTAAKAKIEAAGGTAEEVG